MAEDKRKAFCREYIIDYNATAAYIRAGYKNTSSARCNAARLIAKDNIKAEIRCLTEQKCKNSKLTEQLVLDNLAYGRERGKEKDDLRAYGKFCELEAKVLGLLVERQVIEDTRRQRELTEAQKAEADYIAKHRFEPDFKQFKVG